MRISVITAASVCALGMLTTSTMAASPTTCGELMQMSKAAQAAFIAHIGQRTSTRSLTSTSNNGGSTGNASNAIVTSGADADQRSGARRSTSLATACQGASPSTTLQDAYSHSLTYGANDGSSQ